MYLEDDIPVGFIHQPDDGTCGVHALAHLMNLLGRPSYIEEAALFTNFRSRSDSLKKHFNIYDAAFNFNKTLKKITGGYGVKERGLVSAINKVGWKPAPFVTLSEKEAQEFINQKIKIKSPLLLRVNYYKTPNEDGHWIVCGGINKNKYIVIDSDPIKSNKGILSLYSWEELYRRCTWYNHSGRVFRFNAIAIESNSAISLLPNLNVYLGILQKNLTLQYWWGLYLSDLVDVFEIEDKVENPYRAEEFFENYSKIIKQNISYWFKGVEIKSLNRELKNYSVVASAYNMCFEKGKVEEVLVGFTSALIGTLFYYQ